jgi:predicted MFS family arabinose efflux permease
MRAANAPFTAVGAGYLAASLVPARISARLGRQWPALGGVVMAAGYAILGVMVTSGGAGHVAALTVPLLVIGVGMGMLTAPLTGIVLSQVMPQHVGTVSGLQATTVQLGNSVGVAVIGVVFFGALAGGFAHAFGAALAVLAALPLAAAVAIQFLPRRRG